MLKKILTIFVIGSIASACGATKVTVNNETVELNDGIYAKLTTSMGDILIDFHEEYAPMTCRS